MRMVNHCSKCGRYVLVDNASGPWLCRKCGGWK
jgi:ribosomal protein L37AE/L43A